MAKKTDAKEFPKTFVAENGETIVALNEVQEAAFKSAGLKEKE